MPQKAYDPIDRGWGICTGLTADEVEETLGNDQCDGTRSGAMIERPIEDLPELFLEFHFF